VSEVAIVAMPDERLGERACAFVVLEDGARFGLEDLRQHMRDHGVTPQYWPERVERRDSFPTTPSGKIQRFRLRESWDLGVSER
jgi:non-ribosomal peptide synthetase component E (peptide arylation enzyme)